MAITISAFGALNAESYQEFDACLAAAAEAAGFDYTLSFAEPYPNAVAQSAPGRPLRAEALQDEEKRQQLYKAVAEDALAAGAATADIRVMPCMSMIGFHDGIETVLGLKILRLSTTLSEKYASTSRIGVIHMKPAKQRIIEIFGGKAVTPDDAQAAKLQAAEDEGKLLKSSLPVEKAMAEIAEDWRRAGITEILFARADAPQAKRGPAGQVAGVHILSYFDILAEAVAHEAQKRGR